MNATTVFLIIALYFGSIAIIISKNLLFGVIVFGVFFVAALAFICPAIKKSKIANRKKHEAFHFINRFIISLTITSSFDQAYEDATLEVKGEEKEVIDSIVHLTTLDRLRYLTTYFEEDIFRVFVLIVKVYQEEGGNLLDIASPLLAEAASNEDKQNAIETQKKKSIIQFSSMWFLSSLILCFLRYGLSSFYEIIVKSVPYFLTTAAYFLIAIVSFCVYARAYSDVGLMAKKEDKQ